MPAAAADRWSGYGGDPGRSGAQPAAPGGVPVTFAWERTGTGDRNVKTSMLTTGGPLAAQRVVYGTADGVVHFRRLTDGTPLGGADIGNRADVFGPAGASVSFADTSTDSAPGHLFAAHNEATSIQIAEFDDADGALLRQIPVPGTGGRTIESALLATPPAADGATTLFFVAGGRVFRVPVSASGSS